MADRFLEDYVPVSERLELFRKDHPTWTLAARMLVDDGQRVVMEATVADDDGRVVAAGHAEEVRGSGPVNRTSAVENAETSAWGRALANLGYEVKRGVASQEEVDKVARMADHKATEDDKARHPAAGPLLPGKRQLGRAAQQAGFGGKENFEARRDVLHAAVGKRDYDTLTAEEIQIALEAFEGIRDGTVEFGYDEYGIPTLTRVGS